MNCAKCGEAMRMTEKDTSSGRDIREYVCPGCGYSDWEDTGPALWQILSDAREEAEAAESKPVNPQPDEGPPSSS
jgi:ribosomal protein S27AE